MPPKRGREEEEVTDREKDLELRWGRVSLELVGMKRLASEQEARIEDLEATLAMERGGGELLAAQYAELVAEMAATQALLEAAVARDEVHPTSPTPKKGVKKVSIDEDGGKEDEADGEKLLAKSFVSKEVFALATDIASFVQFSGSKSRERLSLRDHRVWAPLSAAHKRFIPPDWGNLMQRFDCFALLPGGREFLDSFEGGKFPMEVARSDTRLAAELVTMALVMSKGQTGTLPIRTVLFAVTATIEAKSLQCLQSVSWPALQAKSTPSDLTAACRRWGQADGEEVSSPGVTQGISLAALSQSGQSLSQSGQSQGGGASVVSIRPEDSISNVGGGASLAARRSGGRGPGNQGGQAGARPSTSPLCGKCGKPGHRFIACTGANPDWDVNHPYALLTRAARKEYVFPP